MPLLTVFTPTYNRANLLTRLFLSLKKQSCHDFIWLIVDDGSTDNTRQLVNTWIKSETDFQIQYWYKENGGLHTGYNVAIEHLDTELAVCIDSDDYVPVNFAELINDYWKYNGSDDFAGIIGLDFDTKGMCIGEYLPDKHSINIADLITGKYNIKNGDRKLVVRSDLYKKVAPMPSFKGEKFFNPHYMHTKIGLDREYLVLNKCLCIVDYQPQGMSRNMYLQYYNSPNSFAEIRLLDLSLPRTTLLYKFKKSIHYCSSCFLAKRKKFVKKSPCKLITLFALLPGWFFSKIVVRKNKK